MSTQDEAVRLAKEHGGTAVHDRPFTNQVLITMEPDELAALIADVRRQAMEEACECALEAGRGWFDGRTYTAQSIAKAIRARMEEGK